MRYISLITMIFFLYGCMPNLLNSPVRVRKYKKDFESVNKAIIIRIDYRPMNLKMPEPVYLKSLHFASSNAIYNSGKFSDVCLENKSRKKCTGSEKTLYFDLVYKISDISTIGSYRGKNYWWIAWPSIYPFSLVFPIQPRWWKIKSFLEVNIYNNKNQLIDRKIFTGEGETSVFFYGFFAVRPVEALAVNSYESMLDKLTRWLRNRDVKKSFPEKENGDDK